LTNAELQNSHFISKAAYKRVRSADENPNPFINDGMKALQTAKQITAHVLCFDCEQRLARSGEDAFFRSCYQPSGSFPLLELLKENKPLYENDRFAGIVVQEPQYSLVEQIGYMGISLLWKSAAHVWRFRGSTISSINLGKVYQEQIRQFLLGRAQFPEHAALAIEVSDENNRLIGMFGTPLSKKLSTNHLHWIDLLGIRFNLLVGARMPVSVKNLSVFRTGQKCLIIAKKQEGLMVKDYHRHLQLMAG